MFELMEDHNEEAVIKVIGVGGGGGNAVEHMVSQTIEGVEFITANTDSQALRNSSANVTLQLGADVTKGLGAGANPEIGRQSAEEDRETIRQTLEGADRCLSLLVWAVVLVLVQRQLLLKLHVKWEF